MRSSESDDLSDLISAGDSAPSFDVELPGPPPTTVPFFSSKGNIRGILAIGFAALFAATVVVALIFSATPSWSNAKELLQVILPAETAILGSTVGFYFGSKS